MRAHLAPATPARPTRADALQEELVFAAASIARRRPDLIGPDTSSRLVELGWLEWYAGALRMTRAGMQACDAALRYHH